jgi:integrase
MAGDGLEKTAPGRWKARITWHDALGKRRDTDRVIKADTKAQAIAERERIREELAGVGDEWTVSEAIDAWLPSMRTGTRVTREPHARSFRERFGKLRLSRVETTDAQRWIAGIPASDDTANNYRASMCALYKFARAKGRLRGDDPIARTIRRITPRTNEELMAELEGEAPRKALIGDELPRFFAQLLEQEPDLYPLVRCQLLLGCRICETLALQWRDIDWTTGIVTIRRNQSRNGELGVPKNKRRRTCALGPEGLAFMRGHRAAMERSALPGADMWCFPRPLTGRPRAHDMWPYPSVSPRIRAALKAIGVSLACSTHAMRHSHVTLARALESDALGRAAAGQAMRDGVGHASEAMSERYTDESHRKVVAASFAGQLESRIGGALGGADVVAIRSGANCGAPTNAASESQRNRRKVEKS